MSCNCNDEHDTYFDASCVCDIVQFIHELQESPSKAYEIPFLARVIKQGYPIHVHLFYSQNQENHLKHMFLPKVQIADPPFFV